MSNPIPSSVALTNITGTISASPLNSDYTALQTAANGLITALSGGAAGQKLEAADSTHVQWVYPPGYTWDYKEQTADVGSITATTEGTSQTVWASNSVTYDGTAVYIDVSVPGAAVSGLLTWTVLLYEDAVVLGTLASMSQSVNPGLGFTNRVKRTPAAGAHTYTVKAFVSSGTLTVKAGAGGAGNLVPAKITVTKV